MPWPTVADLRTHLGGQDLTAQAVSAQQALDHAIAAVKRYCGRDFAEATAATVIVSGRGSDTLVLPDWPVTSVTAVTVAGVAVAASGWYLDPGPGILHRKDGGRWTRGYGNVAVTYSAAGDIPEHVRLVVLRVAARLLENPQDKAGESFEGMSFSWGSPRILTPDEVALLDRVPAVG